MSTHKFKTVNLHGKSYVQVHDRIKFFRQEEQYKNWAISTEFPMLTTDEALCRCTISDREGMVVAVGHAHETRSGSHINKTSFVENCETSAVGRALGMMGIGIDTSIASANEVEMAMQAEQSAEPAPAKKAAPKKKPAAKKPADKPEPVKQDDPDVIMDAAIQFIKDSTNKQAVYDKTVIKYGHILSDAQQKNLLKWVN